MAEDDLHLPPMKKPGFIVDSDRGGAGHGIIVVPEIAPIVSAPHPRRPHEEEEEEEYDEEFDEEEEDREFQRRLHEHQRHGVSPTAPEHGRPPKVSPPDSTDSGDFVKIDKPRDLFAAAHPEIAVRLQGRDEITPSDDVAAPVGDDLRDFAPSPLHAAHGMADRAHQTFEEFLANSDQPVDRVETDVAALTHARADTARAANQALYDAPIRFDDEDEQTFRRQGPLTLGQPVVEIKPLRHDDNHGLIDGSKAPTFGQKAMTAAQEAAAAVGDFASGVAYKVGDEAAKTKTAVDDLLGMNEERVSATTPIRGSPEINLPARPPTPPKPREPDAPVTPPVLDLGGPGFHHAPPQAPHIGGRKASLKATSNYQFSKFGGHDAGQGSKASWFNMRNWDPNLLDLIYWRDPRKSGIVFGVTLVLLICLSVFNVVCVVSYAGLFFLAATVGFRVYTAVMASVKKSDNANPFQPYLDKNVDLPQDRVHEQVDVVLKHAKDMILHLRRLFLVEDMFETLKFALLLWSFTYVGAYFSGMALIILAFVGLFTLPKVYEMYQPQIDQYYGVVETKVKHANGVAREHLDKVPYFKRKVQEKRE